MQTRTLSGEETRMDSKRPSRCGRCRPRRSPAATYRLRPPRLAALTLRGPLPREVSSRQPLCGDIDGSGLHAAVRALAYDRKRLQ